MTRNHFRFTRYAVLLPVLLSTSWQCLAQDSPWYVGIGAGQAAANADRPAVAYLDYDPFVVSTGPSGPGPTVASSFTSSNEDDSASSYEFLIGYQLNPEYALEFSYQQTNAMGAQVVTSETLTSAQVPDTFTGTRTLAATRESETASLALTGSLPLTERFAMAGMLGLAYTNADMSEQNRVTYSHGGTSSSSRSYTASETSVFAGIGLDVTVTANMTLRLLYRYYPTMYKQAYGSRDSGNNLVESGDVDIRHLGLNLLYRF